MIWHFQDLEKYAQISIWHIYVGDINGDRPIQTTKSSVLTKPFQKRHCNILSEVSGGNLANFITLK
jgi:hypothetical protein